MSAEPITLAESSEELKGGYAMSHASETPIASAVTLLDD